MKRMFAITHIGTNGRQLTFANQGRNHYNTQPEAEQALIAYRDNPQGLRRVIGDAVQSLEVRWVQCYDHGDAVGIYFDNEFSSNENQPAQMDDGA